MQGGVWKNRDFRPISRKDMTVENDCLTLYNIWQYLHYKWHTLYFLTLDQKRCYDEVTFVDLEWSKKFVMTYTLVMGGQTELSWCIPRFAEFHAIKLGETVIDASVREYVFDGFFLKIKKTRFYILLKWHVKKRRKRYQKYKKMRTFRNVL